MRSVSGSYCVSIPCISLHTHIPLFLKFPVLVLGDSDQDLVLALSRHAAGLAAFDYLLIVGLELNLMSIIIPNFTSVSYVLNVSVCMTADFRHLLFIVNSLRP